MWSSDHCFIMSKSMVPFLVITEQELEKSVLLDQQGRLRLCNGELSSTADQLRLKMAVSVNT